MQGGRGRAVLQKPSSSGFFEGRNPRREGEVPFKRRSNQGACPYLSPSLHYTMPAPLPLHSFLSSLPTRFLCFFPSSSRLPAVSLSSRRRAALPSNNFSPWLRSHPLSHQSAREQVCSRHHQEHRGFSVCSPQCRLQHPSCTPPHHRPAQITQAPMQITQAPMQTMYISDTSPNANMHIGRLASLAGLPRQTCCCMLLWLPGQSVADTRSSSAGLLRASMSPAASFPAAWSARVDISRGAAGGTERGRRAGAARGAGSSAVCARFRGLNFVCASTTVLLLLHFPLQK